LSPRRLKKGGEGGGGDYGEKNGVTGLFSNRLTSWEKRKEKKDKDEKRKKERKKSGPAQTHVGHLVGPSTKKKKRG